jgi:hypothetical protein
LRKIRGVPGNQNGTDKIRHSFVCHEYLLIFQLVMQGVKYVGAGLKYLSEGYESGKPG